MTRRQLTTEDKLAAAAALVLLCALCWQAGWRLFQ